MPESARGRKPLFAGFFGVLSLAIVVASAATGNWLTAVAMAGTSASMAYMWRKARAQDRAHRAAFAERLARVRRPPEL